VLSRTRAADGACARFNQHFERMNRWVQTLIVSTYDRVARAVVVEQLIYVAAECRNLRNFNAVIEICLALKSTPIQRLTDTWALVSKSAIVLCDELEKLMLTFGNHASYRAAVAAANPPGVLYFGVCLKDLTFLHDGNADQTRFGLVNVGKWRRIITVLKDIRNFQGAQYNLIVVKEIQVFLETSAILDDDAIHQKSKALQH
jgi:hypothetical protein